MLFPHGLMSLAEKKTLSEPALPPIAFGDTGKIWVWKHHLIGQIPELSFLLII